MAFEIHPLFRHLSYAIQNYPERLSLFELGGLLMEAARENDKRPAYLKVATLDGVVKNLTGKDNLRDAYLIVRIPRDVIDRSESPIVLPGEGNA